MFTATKVRNLCLTVLIIGQASSVSPLIASENQLAEKKIDLSRWKLVWEDEFNYPDGDLEENWESQNGPSGHILCSRWRENAVVADGILELVNKKEQRGGQEWTSGNIWTKKQFQYGYFVCRYRYAEATGTNNSFWLMTRGPNPKAGKRFEIDINEGHYPNEVNTNIHNWTDITTLPNGKKTHPSSHFGISHGMRPDYSLPLEISVKTKKLRFMSTTTPQIHVREFRIYNENGRRYPEALSETADTDVSGLVNHARSPKVKVTASGVFNGKTKPEHAADGTLKTSWISEVEGEKWLQFEWPESVAIGSIQFINGWKKNGKWTGWGQVSDYKIQAMEDGQWKDIATMTPTDVVNFGAKYHEFGLEWNKDELIFYQDGVEIRRAKNDFCHSPAPIWLSLAVIPWAGTVNETIDGTSMKVDWVRYYQLKK